MVISLSKLDVILCIKFAFYDCFFWDIIWRDVERVLYSSFSIKWWSSVWCFYYAEYEDEARFAEQNTFLVFPWCSSSFWWPYSSSSSALYDCYQGFAASVISLDSFSFSFSSDEIKSFGVLLLLSELKMSLLAAPPNESILAALESCSSYRWCKRLPLPGCCWWRRLWSWEESASLSMLNKCGCCGEDNYNSPSGKQRLLSATSSEF